MRLLFQSREKSEQNCVWDQNFDILGVNYWKLLEMPLFIAPNTILGVEKYHVLGKKILSALRDALTEAATNLF